MNTNNIIDVSQWNGVIDWDALRPYINGAIIRMGFGMDQYNQDDWQYARNMAEVERLGIPHHVYFYSYSKGDSTQSEIAHALRLLEDHSPGRVWLDLEERSCVPYFRQVAIDFCSAMEENGRKAGIYAGQEFFGGVLTNLHDWPHWIPAYGLNVGGRMFEWAKPTIGLPMDGWQYTSTAQFTGIVGNVDNSEWYVDFGGKSEPAPAPSVTGSTLELAEAVMLGRYGADQARRQALGDRYDEVQNFINHVYSAPTADLAAEVLAGKYGNGDTRKAVLGDRYGEVQELVSVLVGGNQRQADSTYYYTVQPGDTVSGIAWKMGVQWPEIARLNNLQSPHIIYPGQKLRVN